MQASSRPTSRPPSDLALSPLTMAFVRGYATETLTLRLDGYIAKLGQTG